MRHSASCFITFLRIKLTSYCIFRYGVWRSAVSLLYSTLDLVAQPIQLNFGSCYTDSSLLRSGGSPDRIGGAWQLRRISSVTVNGNKQQVETLYQRDTHKGILLSTPLLLNLTKGLNNSITVGGLWNGFDTKGADLDSIVIYPPEQ